jgi:Dipeptidyl peptidase IV (DPP IV) N-terminal region
VARDGGAARAIGWDSAKFPYLARVRWEKNAPLTLLVQNREQTEQVVLTVDTALQTRELVHEKDAAWLNLDEGGTFRHWLGDGKHLFARQPRCPGVQLWKFPLSGGSGIALAAERGRHAAEYCKESPRRSWGDRVEQHSRRKGGTLKS